MKLNKFFRYIPLIIGIGLFMGLCYVKLFTAEITFTNDPTVAIVKTNDIQLLNNSYKVNTEDALSWYELNDYKILYADEMGHIWQYIHSFMIKLWWIITFSILILLTLYILKKGLNNKYINNSIGSWFY